ncbi:MAG: hypothetical protein IJU11_06770 [Prevotella sp.]|nr:hypothetical protein [Prevotella sp.]
MPRHVSSHAVASTITHHVPSPDITATTRHDRGTPHLRHRATSPQEMGGWSRGCEVT